MLIFIIKKFTKLWFIFSSAKKAAKPASFRRSGDNFGEFVLTLSKCP